jgi:L-aminopeptidase/D-esterase-like protein
VGGARIAGRGGIGDGDRPALPRKAVADNAGEAAACEPENVDRRDPGLVVLVGGFMAAGAGCGVDGIEAEGVIGAASRFLRLSVCSDAIVITEPVSEVVDARRTKFGRTPDGKDGVRECRISMRFARDTG